MSRKSLVWSVVTILLLLTLASPFNFITTFLVMTPFVVLYTMLSPKLFVLHVIPIGIIAYFLSGEFGPIVVTLAIFFLIPSLVMGHMYKKGKSARQTITAGFVVVLAQLLLELVMFSVLFDVNLKTEFVATLTDSFKQFETANLVDAGWAVDSAKAYGNMVMRMLPMLLLTFAFLFTIVTHGLSRFVLRKEAIQVPALPKARTWRVPRSLVLYYFIAMIASFGLSEGASGYWTIVISNLVPILQLVFTIQAIGFFFFLADAKKWPKVVPLLMSIPFFLFPLLYVFIGLIDAAFPLRKYFVK